MIKEIEVGGVKHSITLADNMIGSGLKRADGDKIMINFGSGLKMSSGNALEVDTKNIVGSGLFATEGKISLSIPSIVSQGQGLFFDGRGIAVSGECVSRILSGAGLIATSGLLKANVNTSSGLSIDENKILVKVAYRTSGLRLFFNSSGELDVTQD